MSKRSADVQITSDTCDQDDEPEEAGQFDVASEDQLRQRVIKKARRPKTVESSGLFAGIKFSGTFNGAPPSTSSSLPSFAMKPSPTFPTFTLSTSLTPSPLSFLTSSSTVMPAPPPVSSLPPPITSSRPPTSQPPPADPAPSSSPSPASLVESEAEYLQQLQSLNVSVRDWIDKHVTEDPYVDLTPIFRDYETHLNTIETKYRPTQPPVTSTPPIITFSATPTLSSVPPTVPSLAPPLLVSSSQTTTDEEMTQSSEEGDEDVTVVATSSPKSEPPQAKSDSDTPQAKSDPPQAKPDSERPQAKPDADADAIHSVRAKLFYKKGDGFTELGIGTLKVMKGSEESAGVQLLLRNDTTLGNILLNVRLTASVPLSTKSNNVFLVCPPNPPLDKKGDATPVTYLIRVKTAVMANGLVAAIKDNF